MIIISKNISIKPIHLNNNYKEHIREKLEKYINTCNKKYGYIVKIIDILDISKNTVSRIDIYSVFKVQFSIENFLPKRGDIIDATICMLQDNYIMCNTICNIMIFINKTFLVNDGYVYNKVGVCWQTNDGDKILRMNNNIKVEILDSQYRERKFICTGKILKNTDNE